MALIAGDINASQGMTKAIYDKIREVMEPIDGVSGDQLEEVRDGWKRLSFAIAAGVISHIKSNMEIKKIDIINKVAVQGNSGAAPPGDHHHGVDINVENTDLEFAEINYPAGQGHVE